MRPRSRKTRLLILAATFPLLQAVGGGHVDCIDRAGDALVFETINVLGDYLVQLAQDDLGLNEPLPP